MLTSDTCEGSHVWKADQPLRNKKFFDIPIEKTKSF